MPGPENQIQNRQRCAEDDHAPPLLIEPSGGVAEAPSSTTSTPVLIGAAAHSECANNTVSTAAHLG